MDVRAAAVQLENKHGEEHRLPGGTGPEEERTTESTKR